MSITLDGTVGITSPAGTFSGSLQANGVTGNLYPIVTGTVNAGGANPFPTSGGPTLVDFTGIPSWAKRITVMFNNVSTSGSSLKIVQLGTSSGPIITGYYSEGFSQGSSSSATTGFLIGNSVSSTATIYGSMIISFFGSGNWVEQFGLATGANAQSGGGGLTGAGTIDRVRITTVGGSDTFDAGSINIMYEG